MTIASDKKRVSSFQKIILVVIFAIWVGQPVLFSSTQNTYLLHAMASSDRYFLNNDWQANTVDPFPAFSFLVAGVSRTFGENGIYFVNMILFGLFAYSIIGIVSITTGIARRKFPFYAFILALYLTYSGTFLLRGITHFLEKLKGLLFSPIDEIFTLAIKITEAIYHIAGLLRTGVAHQWLIGILLPSSFGIFLVLSVYAFLLKKPVWAICFIAIAATFHSSYLLSGAMLVLTYIILIWRQSRNLAKMAMLSTLSIVLVLPVIYYNYYYVFLENTSSVAIIARNILANDRLPHHAKPGVWFESGSMIQLLTVITAVFLLRRHYARLLLSIPLSITLALTLLQIATGSNLLALLFPWRMSVVLVPIASSVVLAFLINKIFGQLRLERFRYLREITYTYKVVIFLMVFIGVANIGALLQTPNKGVSDTTMHIRANYSEGDVYLIPTSLETFRLAAGVPIFADNKSHPLKYDEIIEWNDRLLIANEFYSTQEPEACLILDHIMDIEAITHVLRPLEDPLLLCDNLLPLFEFDVYVVNAIVK